MGERDDAESESESESKHEPSQLLCSFGFLGAPGAPGAPEVTGDDSTDTGSILYNCAGSNINTNKKNISIFFQRTLATGRFACINVFVVTECLLYGMLYRSHQSTHFWICAFL